MSINASFHANSKYEMLRVDSDLQHLTSGERSAFVRLTTGPSSLTLFFDSIEDMEKVAFEFSTLVMAARDEWGNPSLGKETK